MRVLVQTPLSSARPTRGFLLATLMGIVAAGLVVGSNFAEDDEAEVEAGGSEQALGILPDQASGALVVNKDPVRVEEVEAPVVHQPATMADDYAYDESDRWIARHAGVLSQREAEVERQAEAERQAAEEAAATTTTTTQAPEAEPTTTLPPDPGAPPEHPDWVNTGYGVYVPPVLLEIRRCESHDNYTAANPTSSARGAYQFTSSTWDGRYGVSSADKAAPAEQDQAALELWQARGTQPWNASSSCWG